MFYLSYPFKTSLVKLPAAVKKKKIAAYCGKSFKEIAVKRSLAER